MKFTSFKSFLVSSVILSVLFLFGLSFGQGMRELYGWAWSSTIRWISFNCKNVDGGCDQVHYAVSIDADGDFSGYAWSNNIGWIDFGPQDSYPKAPYYGASLDEESGVVTGWARVLSLENTSSEGWMSLAGATPQGDEYRVLVDNVGNFSGWAWESEVVGWVNFGGANYGVTVTPRPPICGNNFCELGESLESCYQDCGGGSCTMDSQCNNGKRCVNGSCQDGGNIIDILKLKLEEIRAE